MTEPVTTWQFGTREIKYGAIGAVLYGVFSWASNIFPLPVVGNITFRPAVAVLIFFGTAYGPWVGLLTGLLGNTLGDWVTGWGFSWHVSLGHGLMGMIPGLVSTTISDFRAVHDILKAIGWGAAGLGVGRLFAALMEIFVSGADLQTALVNYFLPAFLGDLLMMALFLPILMITFASVAAHRAR